MILSSQFFARPANIVAKDLLGKVIRVRHGENFISAMIIETEAYFIHEKASHASLGFTQKRKALFMPPGTIYMYYARGGDSLNISCLGEGNAVLIKSAYPHMDEKSPERMIDLMQARHRPLKVGQRERHQLCKGQTLLCKSLGLKVPDWNQKQFTQDFFIEEVGYQPDRIIQTTRLGIPQGRDEDLPYRFIDAQYAKFCTKRPVDRLDP